MVLSPAAICGSRKLISQAERSIVLFMSVTSAPLSDRVTAPLSDRVAAPLNEFPPIH